MGSSIQLQGFHVRPPRDDERAAVDALFDPHVLGDGPIIALAAYGQPGDVLLGATIARPGGGGNPAIAHLLLYVHEWARRRGVGTKLIMHLYQLALANGCLSLIHGGFVNDGSDEHAFARRLGFTPERSLRQWHITVPQHRTWAPRLINRFGRSHPDVVGVQLLGHWQVDALPIAEFFTAQYGGFTDRYLQQIRERELHSDLSVVAMLDGRVLGATLVELIPGMHGRPDAANLRLIAVEPEFRRGPLPLFICNNLADRLDEWKVEHVFFDADEVHDSFATGYGRRCGGEAGKPRHRLSIGADDMRRHMPSD
ncbi:GNAT family N-acetyltransferase [Planctomycetales bacterium ZRK34]|nr:GNAT family N-acetyltransferase [Planctomycetales bacterium ZRK34]